MSVLPNTVPWAVNATDDLQDVADESTTNRTMRATPHHPPHLQLSRSNFISTSPGPLSTPGPTCNTDQSQTYRILPIIAGMLIPLSTLLSFPSLTTHWHIKTDGNENRPIPLLLTVAMSLSMACGVLANICLVLRFAERSVKTMTLLCVILLSMNGSCLFSKLAFLLTNINHRTYKYTYDHCLRVDLSLYRGIRLRTVILDDRLLNNNFNNNQHYANHRLLSYKRFYKVRYVIRYTYYWTSLIIDVISTIGSGLTHKQRSLVIIIIVFLCYITFGSLIQTFMLDITFFDSLYYSVVSIETIGEH